MSSDFDKSCHLCGVTKLISFGSNAVYYSKTRRITILFCGIIMLAMGLTLDWLQDLSSMEMVLPVTLDILGVVAICFGAFGCKACIARLYRDE